MTTPKPFIALGACSLLLVGCATPGATHVYMAGEADQPVREVAWETGAARDYDGALPPGDRVIGLGYEYNTDYVWLRLAPGNRLVAMKRHAPALWYDYTLPDSYQVEPGKSADLAVRAFNRMVYAALSRGRVAEITRYGEVKAVRELAVDGREIGGLAWDQVNETLLVLWADGTEITVHDRQGDVRERIRLAEAVAPFSLAYDSNRARFLVPLEGGDYLGEFNRAGELIDRHPLPAGTAAIDAGQRSTVRVF